MKSSTHGIAMVLNGMLAEGVQNKRMAFLAGVSESHMNRIRGGQYELTINQLNAIASAYPAYADALLSAAHPGFDIKPVEYSVTDLDLDQDGDIDADDCLKGLIATDGELSDGLEAINDGRAGGRRLDSVTGQRAEFILRRLHDQVAKGIARVKRATLQRQSVCG